MAIVFICAMMAYEPLHILFLKFGDPWRHLKKTSCIPNDSGNKKTIDDSSLQMEDSVDLLSLTHQPASHVTPTIQDF